MTRNVQLSVTALDALFPFHFVIDQALRLQSWGPSLPRLLPELAQGQSLVEYVSIQRPKLDSLDAAQILARQHMLFVLRRRSDGLQLRGQFMPLEEQQALLFAGTPWLSDTADLKKHHLALNDFAVHDATADLLQVLQQEKTSLQETASMAERLREQRLMLQSILNTAADAIITINQHGIIETFNPAAEQMFGWQAQEVIGRNVSLLMPEPHASQHDGYIAAFLCGSGRNLLGQRREVLALRRNGESFPAELSLSSIEHSGSTHFTGILRDISRRKAQEAALEAARTRELHIGHEIQQSLLFGKPLAVPGMEIAAFTQPSQGIDGDFFDFFPIEPGCFDIVTGDVMGKGIAAAMIGAAFKHQYNRLMAELLAPALACGTTPPVCGIVNELHERITPELQRLESFVTLTFARIDLRSNRLQYVNAGHPESLLIDASGTVRQLQGEHLPIGIARNETYTPCELSFCPGDLLLIYSDGVTEARNQQGELLGKEPVIALMSALHKLGLPAAIILQRLRLLVDQHEASHRRSDDFTALAMLRCEGSRWHSQEYPRKMLALAPLRDWLLQMASLPVERLDGLILASVEVATNIIRHVSAHLVDASFVVRLSQNDSSVTVEFYYVGDTFDPGTAPEPDFSGNSEGGFGLFIIRESVDRVSYLTPAEQVNLIRLETSRESAPAKHHTP
ncbi:SpoIIE family protein phosphatase [Chitinilyticum piscinae]|uniref:Sensor protein FixL n=1 Tax=Chitinilyticum piscinae TaxID=2866724 RepID=A0A8J7FKT6_9NEIS|nr:SpoIIE family protein phosphatase [Chitinilyticum piscinae]MBE9609555.1 SpoIIE family protein phosphatase [Chitinilyticum piscinae]